MGLVDNLKCSRTASNFTQAEVAKRLNVSRKTISGWENGHSCPDVTSLINLSDLYGVPVDKLIRDDRLSDHYAKQSKEQLHTEKSLTNHYYMVFLFLLLGYVELFRPYNIHSIFLPIFLLVTIVIYLLQFRDWEKFRDAKYTIKAIVLFILLFIFNVGLNIMDSNFLNYINRADIHFLVAFILGRLILIILLSMGAEIIIFFRVSKGQKTRSKLYL